MPQVNKLQRADLVILSTEIGRGHPSYLDGIVETLTTSHPDISYLKTDVFSISIGLSRAAWRLVRQFYYFGARGGVITSLYGILRKVSGSGEGEGLLYRILGRDIRKWLAGFQGLVVVAHPIIARILSEQNQVVYQHGELAAPAESIVRGCRKILVPLHETSRIFTDAGIGEEVLAVTGQCIETVLIPLAESNYENRLSRLRGQSPLTAALFSSGAYPRIHLRRLRLAACSLLDSGHRVIIFIGQSKKIASRFLNYFRHKNILTGTDISSDAPLRIIRSVNRTDDNLKFSKVFEEVDFFVAPAHERTNWGVGLGLPHFILGPRIGSYAPLNAKISLERGVAREIEDENQARRLGHIIGTLRVEGKLEEMACKGHDKVQVSGFSNAAATIEGLIRNAS